MTLYAVISDIHANLDALQAVEKDAEKAAKHLREELVYICLGDVVDYGPQPNECMDWISKKEGEGCIYLIRGNHDDEVGVENIAKSPVTIDPMWWPITMWTRQVLEIEHKKRMRDWKDKELLQNKLSDFALAHGSFVYNNHAYIRNPGEAVVNFEELYRLKKKFGLFGHTHIQGFFTASRSFADTSRKFNKSTQFFAIPETDDTRPYFINNAGSELPPQVGRGDWIGIHYSDSGTEIKDKKDMELAPGTNVLYNPGSVGQPRRPQTWTGTEQSVIDYDSRAAYMLLHLNGESTHRFAFRRIKYSSEGVIKKLKRIEWKKDDIETYFDVLMKGFERQKNQAEPGAGGSSSTDSNIHTSGDFVSDALDELKDPRKSIYYKESAGFENSSSAEKESMAKLNTVTKKLINEKLINFFR